ncbi:formylglycine-generating enzyme family protein [Aquirufa sp. ROCK-SH2]
MNCKIKKIFFLISFMLFATSLLAQKLSSYTQEIPKTDVKFDMVAIPAGEMNRQAIEGFWIGKTEVTYDEYQLFFEEERDPAPKPPVEGPDAVTRPSPPYIDFTLGMGKVGGFPANSMQQFAALMYCKWLYAKTNVFYRLPTEAEWEYAFQLGAKNASMTNLEEVAWYAENSGKKYAKVALKKPNALGIYDMLGNVSEWVLDHYQEKRSNLKPNEAVFIDKYADAVVKGGNFHSEKKDLTWAYRIPADPIWNRRDPQIPKSKWWNADAPFVGFRIVRPSKQPSETEVRAFFAKYLDE